MVKRLDHAGVLAAQVDLLSNRVLAREVLSGQGLVDHHHGRRRRDISVANHASADDWGAQGLGIVATDSRYARVGLIGRILRLAEDIEA